MASLSLRICLEPNGRIGPGKIKLLEEIGRCGSISGAGRNLAMSYRRAWELVEDMNNLFEAPVVASQVGGRKGGGATLTAFGQAVVGRYRAIEQAAADAARQDLAVLQAEVANARATETTDEQSTVEE